MATHPSRWGSFSIFENEFVVAYLNGIIAESMLVAIASTVFCSSFAGVHPRHAAVFEKIIEIAHNFIWQAIPAQVPKEREC